MSSAKTVICVAVLLLLAGCGSVVDPQSSKRGLLRKQYFDECMKLVPPGPQQTHYNDWAEVIAECNSVSHYQANQVLP